MKEAQPKVILSAIGYDREGRLMNCFRSTLPQIDQIYPNTPRLFTFLAGTNPKTIDSALTSGWQVVIEEHTTPIEQVRLKTVERALALGGDDKKAYWINFWDKGDELLATAKFLPSQLIDLRRKIADADYLEMEGIYGLSDRFARFLIATNRPSQPDTNLDWAKRAEVFANSLQEFKKT